MTNTQIARHLNAKADDLDAMPEHAGLIAQQLRNLARDVDPLRASHPDWGWKT